MHEHLIIYILHTNLFHAFDSSVHTVPGKLTWNTDTMSQASLGGKYNPRLGKYFASLWPKIFWIHQIHIRQSLRYYPGLTLLSLIEAADILRELKSVHLLQLCSSPASIVPWGKGNPLHGESLVWLGNHLLSWVTATAGQESHDTPAEQTSLERIRGTCSYVVYIVEGPKNDLILEKK